MDGTGFTDLCAELCVYIIIYYISSSIIKFPVTKLYWNILNDIEENGFHFIICLLYRIANRYDKNKFL